MTCEVTALASLDGRTLVRTHVSTYIQSCKLWRLCLAHCNLARQKLPKYTIFVSPVSSMAPVYHTLSSVPLSVTLSNILFCYNNYIETLEKCYINNNV